jgi:hypothetical protein
MTIKRSKHRGISLIMVTAVVAVASVMGMAILSSNALQAEASSSQDQVVQADALAESGVNQAMYYIQNIGDGTKCPAGLQNLGIGSPAFTQTGTSIGSSVQGTFDLAISRTSNTQYQVVSTGKSTASTAGVKRSLTTVLDVNYFGYGVTASNITSGGGWTIPANMTIVGDVYSNSSVINNGTITGTLYANTTSGSGNCGLIKALTGVIAATGVPSLLTVNHYATYTYNGKLGVTGTILPLAQSNVTYGPNALNPAGVYTCIGTLPLNGNVKINGTLIVSPLGALTIKGTGNTITPVTGFPALVNDGDITFKANNATLDINGLAYIGGGVLRSGSVTGCALNVTGNLLCAGASTSFEATVTTKITYDRHKASVPDLLAGSKPTPTSLSIVSWKN